MKAGLLIALWFAASGSAPVAALRARYADAQAAVAAEHTQVQAQQAQLDTLSAQIASEKAKQAGQPSLFVPGELEKNLAQSQALSDALGRSRTAEGAGLADLEQARAALYGALSTEISARERQGGHDASAIGELQQLQAERAQVAPQAAPATASPHFQGQSDDPRELRERADALRDQADKLGKQEGALAARIQAAQDQARLERQLQRLHGTDALFDESDRRVRVSRTDAPASAALSTGTTTAFTPTTVQSGPSPKTGANPPQASASMAQTRGGSDSLSNNSGPTSSADALGPTPTASATAPSPNAVPGATELPTVHTGELVRAEDLGLASAPADGEEENLPALLRARERLVKQRAALEAQAKVLEGQASGK